jgi:hypothetical protein
VSEFESEQKASLKGLLPNGRPDLYGELSPEVRDRVTKTQSGIYFPILAPDPALVRIEDVAHSLARICRYNGHWIDFCSVAAHSIEVSNRLAAQGESLEVQLWGLLHDASEAYCGDMVNPLKRCGRLDAYIEIEDAVQQAVALHFGLPWPMPDVVHIVDQKVGAWEREHRRSNTRMLYLVDHIGEVDKHDYCAQRFLGHYKYLRAAMESAA